jgi:uncharacterized membrane protein
MLFQTLKWIHILLAIVGMGANITYAVWIRRATLDRDSLPFTLRTIKLIDSRMSTPAYGLLLVSGFWMVLISDLQFESLWLSVSIFLWLALILMGVFGYTPTLRKQIELAETVGPDDAAYKSVAGRGVMLGMLLAVIVLTIVYLMVFKPI